MYSYARSSKGSVHFWWIKPQAKDPNALERNTLNLHATGAFKNAAARAKAVYEPLADKFNGSVEGDFTFGVDDETGRAFIDEDLQDGSEKSRLWLYFVWQEKWSSMMSYSKFIKGKLFYQKGSDNKHFYARQYKIQDSQLSIMEVETEEDVPS